MAPSLDRPTLIESRGSSCHNSYQIEELDAEDFKALAVEALQSARRHLKPNSSPPSSSCSADGDQSPFSATNSSSLAGNLVTNFHSRQCRVLMDTLEQDVNDLLTNKLVMIQWPKQALKELYRVLKSVGSLFEACCSKEEEEDSSYLKAALRQPQRTQEFREALKEIMWCTSVVYYHNSCQIRSNRNKPRPSNIVIMDLQDFPQPGMAGFKEQFMLEKAAEEDWQELLQALDIWNREHTCSAEVCGHINYARGQAGANSINYCLSAQILQRWNEEKLGVDVADDVSPTSTSAQILQRWHDDNLGANVVDVSEPSSAGKADHQSLLWSLDDNEDVLKPGRKRGSGAYGSVSEVKWLGDKYAHKLFNVSGGQNSLLADEAGALAKLNHPHIIKVLACTGDSYLMDLMNTDLCKYISSRKHPFSLPAAIDLILQLADAMRYLHSQKMAHRDLKSPNILVNPIFVNLPGFNSEGYVVAKIADFGLAKTKREITANSHLTRGTGTTKWMAPEISVRAKRGEHHSNALAFPMKLDVYSFGIICFEILSGEEPFHNVDLTDLHEKLAKNFRPQLPSSCPENLASLIKRCWHTDPQTRPSFPEICRELSYLKGLLMTDLNKNQLGGVELPSGTTAPIIPHQTKSLVEYKLQGPWGMQDRIRKLMMGLSDDICAIRLSYYDSQMQYLSGFQLKTKLDGVIFEMEKRGLDYGTSSEWIEFDHPSGEYITRVEGSTTTKEHDPFHIAPFVTCLKIITNRRTWGPFGKFNEATAFKTETGRVVGFFGYIGDMIDLLGVLIVPECGKSTNVD